jgi:RNA polymerase sigma factor (sigma-70 family)
MRIDAMPDAKTLEDTQLVELGLSGNRDAFGQLVARYQSPICALAYSACGNISQSEDLAQETFIIAWRKLGDLKEPAKFKSWLYGIARNQINSAFRQQVRNPLAAAESLDESRAGAMTGSNPAEQAISQEEEGILWRSLERIPEAYREPLVLFYREHHSTERVAAVLELSEEAVRQRLSRGRKMLEEQVLAFVEGALERTNPGQAFTLGVLAALPAMTFCAKAATLGAAAKGGAWATGAGVVGLAGAILTPLLAFVGMWKGYRMERNEARSDGERKFYKDYYKRLTGCIFGFILIACILMSYGGSLIKTNPSLFAFLITGLILGYPVVLSGFFIWRHRARKRFPAESTPAKAAAKPKSAGWEYRSRFQLLGLPFIHIRLGGWQWGVSTKTRKPVKAWIAVDDAYAFGVLFAYGAVAVAPVSIGACAIGLLSYGAMAAGMFPVGGFGFGVWACGAFAFGWQAAGGGCAIAWKAAWSGQYAIAHYYAVGEMARALQTNSDFVHHLLRSNPFFRISGMILPYFFWLMWVWAIPMLISMIVQWRLLAESQRTDQRTAI